MNEFGVVGSAWATQLVHPGCRVAQRGAREEIDASPRQPLERPLTGEVLGVLRGALELKSAASSDVAELRADVDQSLREDARLADRRVKQHQGCEGIVANRLLQGRQRGKGMEDADLRFWLEAAVDVGKYPVRVGDEVREIVRAPSAHRIPAVVAAVEVVREPRLKRVVGVDRECVAVAEHEARALGLAVSTHGYRRAVLANRIERCARLR